MQKTWIQSLGGEDTLKKEMATHSSILVWKIPWTEELSGYKSMRSQKGRTGLSDYTTTKNIILLLISVCVYLPFSC